MLRAHRSGTCRPTAMLTAACLLLFCGAVGQVGPVPAARLAARRDGRPDARQRPDPRRDDGDGRRLPGRPLHAAVRACARRPSWSSPCIGGFTALLAALIAADADRPEARAGLLDGQPARLHVPGAGQRHGEERAGRRSPSTAAIFHLFTHAFFKALLFLGRRQRDARDGRRHRHAPVQRPAASAADHALDVPVRGRWRWPGVPLLSGFWSKDEILGACLTQRRTTRRTARSTSCCCSVGAGHGGADGVLHVPRLLPDVLGRGADSATKPGHHAHESPPVMTVPLMILAVGAVGRRHRRSGRHALVRPLPRTTHWIERRSAPLPRRTAAHHAELALMRRQQRDRPGRHRRWRTCMYVRQPALAGRLARACRRALSSCRATSSTSTSCTTRSIVQPLDGAGADLPRSSIVRRRRPGRPGRPGAGVRRLSVPAGAERPGAVLRPG